MSALKTIRDWLATFPGYTRLQSLRVDYLAAEPDNGSIAPSGLIEISRKENIFGDVIVEKQYNFGLYYIFTKATEDDEGSTENADWIIDLQEWVLEQSILGQAPTFGDDPKNEKIKAQNGTIYGATDDGTAIYMVQLSINFLTKYTR